MKFVFFEQFKELENLKGIKAGDKRLKKLCVENEACIGHRQVGDRSYHIFYFVLDKKFCLYYHGGGTDAMYTTDNLDEILEHVNALEN